MRFGNVAVAILAAFAPSIPTASAFRPPPSNRYAAPPPLTEGGARSVVASSPLAPPLPSPRAAGALPRKRRPFSVASSSRLSASAAPIAEDLAPGIDAIDAANDELCALLNVLREQPHFRLYSVDILASCEYMPQELFECYSETCEIYPVDDDEVPPAIKAVDSDEHDFELDGWARWDMPSEDYYDTTQFPEDFTGYDGSEVWRFIHDRIGFHDESIVDEYDSDNWKADFNKAVSGLHAMVSAQVVRSIADKVAADEEFDEGVEWTDPRAEFDRRLGPDGETPKAIENLYFAYMLTLTAVAAARDRLLRDCDSGKIDEAAAAALRPVLAHPLLDDTNIAVASRKLHDHAVKDECSVQALWEARMRTRELMRIMNCVQCNKCRFHGKIVVLGLSTTFQVLLGRSGDGGDPSRIHRVELAALMTAMAKFSTAVNLVKTMQR